MPPASALTFSLDVDLGGWDPEQVVVSAFGGVEALSRPFELQVDFLPLEGSPIEWAEMLGKSAALGIQVAGGEMRHVHGHVHGVESLQPVDGWPRYRIRLVPDLERLRHVHRSRIYQDQSTPDIVKAVLDDAGIEHRWELTGSYGKREYCTQYRESNLDFISRLLEWEGIFYFFEHSQDGHVLVLSDAAASAVEMQGGGGLLYREERGLVPDREHVTRFEQVRRVRPTAVVTRDFDFKNPALDLTANAQGQAQEGAPELELYDYPEGYGTPADGRRMSAVRLEERQQRKQTHSGTSTCPRLCPGYTFELEEPAPEGAAGKYLAVEVHHRGERQLVHEAQLVAREGTYRNELRCLAGGTPFRPRRQTRWPVLAGIQTATVVGPAGEEIHPDEHGRIKVQFHWDREGGKDDHSSCFIRVGQVWGGGAWGGVYLPRIGQEVVVRFLEGNPDRPLITGAVYNGQNTAPYMLPGEKTKSTLKSSSSLGGDGFNELRLEDAAGEEEIYVHAQKDEQFITENDKAQDVRGYEARLVKKDRTSTVEGNQSLEVARNDAGLVEQNQTLQVTGNRTTAVTGMHAETVEGQQGIQVAKNQAVQVALSATTGVGGVATLSVGGQFALTIGMGIGTGSAGALSRSVGGDHTESVAGSREETVTKDLTLKVNDLTQADVRGKVSLVAGGDVTYKVNGESKTESEEATAWPAKAVELKADKLSFVVGGKRLLQLEKSGNITLAAASVSVDGSEVKGKGANVKKVQPASPPSAQVQALHLAALNGMPFCEECERRGRGERR